MSTIKKRRIRKIILITFCTALIMITGTVFCFATDGQSVNMTNLLKEIVSLMVSGIADFGAGLASGIGGYIEGLFISSTGQLSATGGIIVIFAAVALCVGITKLVWFFITSFGSSR